MVRAIGRMENPKCYHFEKRHKFWTQRLKFSFPKFYWHKGLHMQLGYKVYCRKCGSLISMGNTFRLREYFRGGYQF